MATQVTTKTNQLTKQRLGYNGVSLTQWTSDNTTVPQITAGSKLECGGSLYEFGSAENVDSGNAGELAAAANSTLIYLAFDPTDLDCRITTSAPTWNTANQEYEVTISTHTCRVYGSLYKDGSGNYTNKVLWKDREVGYENTFATPSLIGGEHVIVNGLNNYAANGDGYGADVQLDTLTLSTGLKSSRYFTDSYSTAYYIRKPLELYLTMAVTAVTFSAEYYSKGYGSIQIYQNSDWRDIVTVGGSYETGSFTSSQYGVSVNPGHYRLHIFVDLNPAGGPYSNSISVTPEIKISGVYGTTSLTLARIIT